MTKNPLRLQRHISRATLFALTLLAIEFLEDFVNKLVERGQIAETDGKKLVKDIMDRSKKDVRKTEAELDKRVEEILTRMNIPTKNEIEALGQKITVLTKKVEELKKSA